MHELIFKHQAVSYLEKIYEFTFLTWGFVQAEKCQDELFAEMQSLLSYID